MSFGIRIKQKSRYTYFYPARMFPCDNYRPPLEKRHWQILVHYNKALSGPSLTNQRPWVLQGNAGNCLGTVHSRIMQKSKEIMRMQDAQGGCNVKKPRYKTGLLHTSMVIAMTYRNSGRPEKRGHGLTPSVANKKTAKVQKSRRNRSNETLRKGVTEKRAGFIVSRSLTLPSAPP